MLACFSELDQDICQIVVELSSAVISRLFEIEAIIPHFQAFVQVSCDLAVLVVSQVE